MISRGAPSFWAAYHVLPPAIKQAAKAVYQKFRENPDPRAWSVRVTRDYRAVARRYQDDTWEWVWIGSHRDFDRVFVV